MSYSPSGVISTLSQNNNTTAQVGGSTVLTTQIANSSEAPSTIVVNSTAQFPSSGTLKINNEYFDYTTVDNATTFSGITRNTYYSGNEQHDASDNVIGVYIGTSERNFQPDALVCMKSDQAGTLYCEFSDNNTNWETDTINGSSVLANTYEEHKVRKGPRYFRVRFENGSGTLTTTLKINTYFGQYGEKTFHLNESIDSSTHSSIVRAVLEGKQPDGTYKTEYHDGYVLNQSGSNLIDPGPFQSDLLDLDGYSQIQLELFSDVDGTLSGIWYDDSSKTTALRTFTFPYTSSSNLVSTSAPVFTQYVEYSFTKADGTTPSSFLIRLKLLTQAVSGQVLGVKNVIASNMVCNLQRAVSVGEQPDGDFVNLPADGSAWSFTTLPVSATLNGAILDGSFGTISVDPAITTADWAAKTNSSTTDFYIAIDNEIIKHDYSQISTTSFDVDSASDRGQFRTEAANHDDNSIVREVITSRWVDTDGWNTIELFIQCNQPSMSRGLIIQFTDDVQASPSVARETRRFSYTNEDARKGSRLLLFKPCLAGFRVLFAPSTTLPTGNFIIDATFKIAREGQAADDSLPISIQNHFQDRFSRKIYMMGVRTSFPDNTTLTDICPFSIDNAGGNNRLYTPADTANAYGLTLSSTNANDVATTGTGVRRVGIMYLDSNWEEQYIEVDMNGTTDVTPVASGVMRVNDLFAIEVGNNGVAAGRIDLTTISGQTIENSGEFTTNPQILRQIAQGGNKDLTALYTVPLNHTLYANSSTLSSANSDQDFRLRSNTNPYNREIVGTNCFLDQSIVFIGSNRNNTKDLHSLKFPAKADIKISSISSQTGGDCSVYMSFTLVEDL